MNAVSASPASSCKTGFALHRPDARLLRTVEISGLDDFTDTLIKAKLNALTKGKKSKVVEVSLTVGSDAFVIGKEIKDILWPYTCLVLSLERTNVVRGTAEIFEGDIITVHYETYDPKSTADELECLAGKQSDQVRSIMLS